MSESHPGQGAADDSSAPSDKDFTCSKCGDTLSYTSAYYHVQNVCPSAGVDCPECGKSMPTKRGMKMHYNREHEGSIAGVIVECDYCGDEFRQRVSRAGDGAGDFCDKECYNNWLAEDAPRDHFNDQNRVKVDCSNCGETIERHPFEVKRSANLYCDMNCYSEWRSDNIRGKRHPMWDGGPAHKECAYCGEITIRRESTIGERVFCNYDCYGQWLSENRSGKDSPFYKENKVKPIDYGPNFPRQRRKARKRAHYQCEICGKDERDLGHIPHTHHIIKIRYYQEQYDAPDWYEKGNDLDNLILLCPEHHWEWEGIPLRPQVD